VGQNNPKVHAVTGGQTLPNHPCWEREVGV